MSGHPIYTIGYGAQAMEPFIAALQRHGIAFLIDVRSKPYSRFKPEFSRDALEEHLRGANIRYVFMGDSLGGRPADRTCYDDNDKVDYAKVAVRDFYLSGIDRLVKAQAQDLAVCIMCSEGKPENCHRSKLIGRTLASRGIQVSHIDENDELISQAAVQIRLDGGQPSLFGDLPPGTSRKRYAAEKYEHEDEEDE